MKKTINIAIAGLGTVGGGVLTILKEKAELLQERTHIPFKVVAVSARNPDRQGADISGIDFVKDAVTLADRPDVDVVVELIGGAEGVAYDLCKKALENGKHVVTANKALVAHHGVELSRVAEQNKVTLAFEAAVAGGIPVIKVLKEGLAANNFTRIYGILNGTCNYILTEMQATGRSFEEVLKDAQSLGYAEADPSFDVDGVDAAHKLAILTSLAFGTPVNLESMHISGIRAITPGDIRFAAELGYKIKLLGIAARTEAGIEQRVHPCLVPLKEPIARIDGVYNAVVIEGDSVGKIVLEGRGAGSGPTASAVVADLVDIACGRFAWPLNSPIHSLRTLPYTSIDSHYGAYYVRLTVTDKPGVLAAITEVLRKYGISMESVLQKPHTPSEAVQIVLTTHKISEKTLNSALEEINTLDCINQPAHSIRITD